MPSWSATSVTSESLAHRIKSEPCQDSVLHDICNDRVILVVCDGAGSSEYFRSDIVAQTAAYSALIHSQKLLTAKCIRSPRQWKHALQKVAKLTIADLLDLSASLGIPLERLGTTLIVAAATNDRIVSLQIGDGAVVVCNNDGKLIPVTSMAGFRFANQTQFVSPKAKCVIRKHDTQIQGIAAFSDGLEVAAFEGERPFAGFFGPLFRWSQELTQDECKKRLNEFLNSDDVLTLGDDTSLCLATYGEHK